MAQKKAKKGELEAQLSAAQAEVRADGYEMSIGELISIYEKGEIQISPRYQRLFRWSLDQKSKFIESILIGIPIPPIFVFQSSDGKWELVDGLQRVSTLLEFRGVLRGKSGKRQVASKLSGTALMPALEGAAWEGTGALPEPLKLRLQRARIRVEILQTGSSPRSRFELFQRLNTGGSLLTRQEIRTCSVIMADESFQTWLEKLSSNKDFLDCTKLTPSAKERQRGVELVIKYLVFNLVEYKAEWDLHDYLDEGVVSLALDKKFDRVAEEKKFKDVFNLINKALGQKAFRRESSGRIVGSFSDAAFEALAIGVRANLAAIAKKPGTLVAKVADMWSDDAFKKNTGAGVRGTTRIVKIVPFARAHFK
ncbi:DUF262 domain-containing protein [Luteimonas wenzhouensis]|uniref:DUF262 domain-containing protein n=1 Tax=Luteimonas wenzhouensis TaxID=2599615 RepID=A0A5C5U6K5_9GAMM|nr:DUF262 domain-containing protein [Luteimonas wenzhouensis]TWT21564.1 DUF262 domain-containing protein [Luteimonas wenzhouensis]